MVETPANFSKYFLKRLWSSIDADEETLNRSSINVRGQITIAPDSLFAS